MPQEVRFLGFSGRFSSGAAGSRFFFGALFCVFVLDFFFDFSYVCVRFWFWSGVGFFFDFFLVWSVCCCLC